MEAKHSVEVMSLMNKNGRCTDDEKMLLKTKNDVGKMTLSHIIMMKNYSREKQMTNC